MANDEVLIDQVRLSKMLGISTKTAEAWRSRRGGPPYIKVGSLVRYRVSDVMRWIERRTVESDAEESEV